MTAKEACCLLLGVVGSIVDILCSHDLPLNQHESLRTRRGGGVPSGTPLGERPDTNGFAKGVALWQQSPVTLSQTEGSDIPVGCVAHA